MGEKHTDEEFSEDDLIKEMIQILKANPKPSQDAIMVEKLTAHVKEIDENKVTSMICDMCAKTLQDLMAKRNTKKCTTQSPPRYK